MSDVTVTLFGYVGSDVEFHGEGNGTDRAIFRVGSTPRFFDRSQGSWRDLETVWVTVKTWRALAHNVASSIHKGDPVVVVGKLRAQVWVDKEGQQQRRDVLEATTVCHDLARGTSAFRRSERPADRATETPDDEELIRKVEAASGAVVGAA
jgi:single-strand DNA-binding protein